MKRNAHKFNAVKTVIDGHTFASKAEGRRYAELKLLVKARQIHDLELQPKFPIVVLRPNGDAVTVAVYKADFRYKRPVNGLAYPASITEDVKSPATKTAVYQLKKKMVEALYGIEIVEVYDRRR